MTAFLVTGIVGQSPGVIGEPYRDRLDNIYNALSAQPIIILSADSATLVMRAAATTNLARSNHSLVLYALLGGARSCALVNIFMI